MTHPPRGTPMSGLITMAVATLGIAILFAAKDVLIPITLSVLIAFLLAAPVSWLERRRFGRVVSVVLVVSVAVIVVAAIGWVVGRQVVSLATELPHYSTEIKKKVESVRGSGSGMGSVFAKLGDEFKKASELPASQPATQPKGGSATEPAGEASGGAATGPAATGPSNGDGLVTSAAREAANPAGGVAREVVGGPPATAPSAPGLTPANPLYTVTQAEPTSPWQTLLSYLEVVVGSLGQAGLIAVFVVFILLEREALRDRIIAVISRGDYTATTRALDDASTRISRYLVAQSIVNGSYGLIIGTGLWLIGAAFGHGTTFPSFVLWGLLCAVLRFIPYVGPAVSSIFPVVLALAVYPGFTVAVATVALFVVVELISNNVMEPWLYGASTGLSTVAILVAAVFWAWLWGPVGLLVATPLTVCVAVLGKYVRQLNFLHVLLGDEDGLPPAVSFYQRLLAGDPVEAEAVVRRTVIARGTARIADDVYLPALRMARRDRTEERLTAEDEKRIFDLTLKVAARLTPPAGPSTPDSPAAGLPAAAPRVLAYPAHHAGDEVALRVLADVLTPAGVQVQVLTTRSMASDVEAAIDRDRPVVLVLSILPPGGLTQARYLCRRLRRKFPDLPILVGCWGRPRDFDRLLVRMRKAGASYVLTSAEQTRDRIGAMLPKPPVSEPTDVTSVPRPA